MAESLAQFFVELFKDKIPPELTIFIVSLLPILELRGGMIAAKLLDVEFVKAFFICYLGNMLPIPFILLFIKKIFEWLRKFKFFEKIITKLEAKTEKNKEKVLRYKSWGLLIFVAIPLPGTGGPARARPPSSPSPGSAPHCPPQGVTGLATASAGSG